MEIIDQFSTDEEETPITNENELPISPLPSRSLSNMSSAPTVTTTTTTTTGTAAPIVAEKMMTISRLREALVFADPDNQRAGVNKLLARACGVGIEEMLVLESKRTQFSIDFLKKNLKQGIIKKSYPTIGGNSGDSRKLNH